MWAHAYLERSHFIQYTFNPPNTGRDTIGLDDTGEEQVVSFAINGKQLLECLQIFGKTSVDVHEEGQSQQTLDFGGSSSVRSTAETSLIKPRPLSGARAIESSLTYKEIGERLELLLVDRQDSATTTCRFVTFESVQQSEADFMASTAVCKLIMKSVWLQDTLGEFSARTENIVILVSPTKPYLKLSTDDFTGKTDIEYSNDTNVIEYFTCTRPIENR